MILIFQIFLKSPYTNTYAHIIIDCMNCASSLQDAQTKKYTID